MQVTSPTKPFLTREHEPCLVYTVVTGKSPLRDSSSNSVGSWKTRQDKTRQDKTRQDKTRQDKTKRDLERMFRSGPHLVYRVSSESSSSGLGLGVRVRNSGCD